MAALSSDERPRRQRSSETFGSNADRGRSSSIGSSARGGGYSLRQRSINFGNKRKLPGFLGRLNTRGLIVFALAVILLLALLFGIASCARGCSQRRAEEAALATINPDDSRVGFGTSAGLTSELTGVLDRNEDMAWIAEHANEYGDERIVQLAIDEPEAVSFVRNYLESEKRASDYGEGVGGAGVPQLYAFDARWGAFEYASLPLAVSGSGPTSLAMAYVGLTGKTDKTPADIAALAATDNLATGDAFFSEEFFEREANNLGLTYTKLEQSTAQAVEAVNNKQVVLCLVRADTLTDKPHWVVISHLHEEDGSVDVYDPTSSIVTTHRWDASTVIVAADAIYAFGTAATQTD